MVGLVYVFYDINISDEYNSSYYRNSQMKWSGEHDVMLGREIMLFELWKYKAGSRERGQCLDRIAESLNHLERPSFSVSQKSVRDRLKILERDFKKKERSEKNASGISPEKTEIVQIMEILETEGRSGEGVREGLRGISG